MDTSSISLHPYALFRVHADGTEEPVSSHPAFEQGWSAGQHAVHADRENAYSLYRGGRRVARFNHHKLAPARPSMDWSVLA